MYSSRYNVGYCFFNLQEEDSLCLIPLCINQPIIFSDTIPNTTAYWDFGDGSGLIAANTITHTYTSPGMYNVMLIIENIYGCKDTVFNSIEIAEPPDASFVLDVQNGCAILPVTITNQSTLYGGSTYIWDYGNGVTDTLFNPGLIYFDQGSGDSTIYNIQLVVANGCGVASYSASIVVYPIPVPEFGVIFSDSCSPALVMFNNITTGNPQTYQWFINGVFVSSDSILPPQIFLADSTDSTYVVMLVASNFCGQDTIFKNVVIHPNQVTAFFNTDVVYGCKPLQVTLRVL
ncbi:MAG: PKD domain-containing protein [Bacteroidetes bacterium]|nr:PKD domain-containing protein [Bacteroidota bacterium]